MVWKHSPMSEDAITTMLRFRICSGTFLVSGIILGQFGTILTFGLLTMCLTSPPCLSAFKYEIFSNLERKTCATLHPYVTNLKTAFEWEQWADLPKDLVKKAVWPLGPERKLHLLYKVANLRNRSLIHIQPSLKRSILYFFYKLRNRQKIVKDRQWDIFAVIRCILHLKISPKGKMMSPIKR